MKKGKSLILCLILFLITSIITNQPVKADVKIDELGNVFDEFLVGMELATFMRTDEKPAYGSKDLAWGKESTAWGEIFSRINLTAKKDIEFAKLEAKISPVFLTTIGKDVYSLYKNKSDVDLNKGYIKLGNLLKSPWSLTIGMQDIEIEKQFIIGNGQQQEAAAWALYHTSFPFAVRLDGDFGSWSTSAFWAKSKNYPKMGDFRDDVDVAGINFHINLNDTNYIYSGYYQKIDDSHDNGFKYEFETKNISAGGDFTFGMFNIEGEYVYQWGDVKVLNGNDLDRESFAFFISPKITLPVTYSPYVKLHYIHYSGDNDRTDDKWKEYDPMFWGFPGWNKWVIGELVGETQLLNSNKREFIVEAGFWPSKTLNIFGTYIKHKLDKKYMPGLQFGSTELPDKDWADEFNLFVEWSASDNLFISLGAGVVIPDDAAKALFGNDDTATFCQLLLYFQF